MTAPAPGLPGLPQVWRLSADRTYLYAGPSRYFYATPPPVDPTDPTAKAAKLARIRFRSVFTPTIPPADRSSLVPGVDKPDDTNTGVFTGTTFTDQNSAITYGNVNSAASPQQITNMNFTDKVTASGQYIDFHNCFFRGPNGPVPSACVNCTSGARNIRFYDCTFEQQNPIWDSPGAKGWQCEYFRCRFKGVTDGFQHIGTGSSYTGIDQNITVQQCYFDNFAYMSPDPGAAGGLSDNSSHVDCVQTRGGRNILIWGNTMYSLLDMHIGGAAYQPIKLASGTRPFGNKYATPTFDAHQGTSCVMMSPNLGAYGNFRVKENWMDGASTMINFNPTTTVDTGVPVGIEITGNRVGYDSRTGNNKFIIAPTGLKTQVTVSGNVRPDTGAPANFWQAG